MFLEESANTATLSSLARTRPTWKTIFVSSIRKNIKRL